MSIPYNPLHVTSFIRDLLQVMYREYGGDTFAWDKDPRKSQIVIGTVNDIHSDARTQAFPRILIQRGPSLAQSQSISNNLDIQLGGGTPAGGSEIFRQDVSGSLNFIIETVNEGSCETLGEFTRKFICWGKPFIESMFNFQAFAKSIQVSSCEMDREDTEKFKININVPYIVEDRWMKSAELIRLNHIFTEMVNSTTSDN